MMKAFRWINVILFACMILINMLANTIPLGGKNTGEISAGYENLFTPAPYTFSIWALIYILMAIFTLFQTEIFRGNTEVPAMGNKIEILFTLSCLLNILWIMTWHYDHIGLSVIIIALLLLDLIAINSMIKPIDKKSVAGMLISYGFQIYMGWLAAATIANISVFLVKMNWSRFGFSEGAWTVVILVIGALIGAGFVIKGSYFFSTLAVCFFFSHYDYCHNIVSSDDG